MERLSLIQYKDYGNRSNQKRSTKPNRIDRSIIPTGYKGTPQHRSIKHPTQIAIEHSEEIPNLHNLGNLYKLLHRYEEAEPFYQQALNIAERLLVVDNAYSAQNLERLSNLYYGMGKFTEAQSQLVRALKMYEQQLGGEHIYTALR